jgi:hypothetical protein
MALGFGEQGDETGLAAKILRLDRSRRAYFEARLRS